MKRSKALVGENLINEIFEKNKNNDKRSHNQNKNEVKDLKDVNNNVK